MTPFHAYRRQPESPALGDRLRLRLVHLGGVVLDRGWCGGDMASPLWRIYVDLDEGAAMTVGGRTIPLRAGHAYVVPAWLSWRATTRDGVRHANALLDLPALGRDALRAAFRAPVHLPPGRGPLPAFADEFAALCQEVADGGAPTLLQHARGYALAYAAVAAAFGTLPPARCETLWAGPGPLATALTVAERELDGLDLDRLAVLAGVGRAQLTRLFRRHLGTTPAHWLRARRVALAAELLRATDDGIDAIAGRCGLGDRYQLTRVFTRLLGVAPATWRRRERQSA